MPKDPKTRFETLSSSERETREKYLASLGNWVPADKAHKKWIGAVEGLKCFFQKLRPGATK